MLHRMLGTCSSVVSLYELDEMINFWTKRDCITQGIIMVYYCAKYFSFQVFELQQSPKHGGIAVLQQFKSTVSSYYAIVTRFTFFSF